MGKSQESYNKKEKEKKRLKKRKEKRELREQRKAERDEAGPKSFEDMISYVDGDGNLTKTKPDPKDLEIDIELEDIIIGAPPRSDEVMDTIRIGRVKFFNDEKGYGFIIDKETKESLFVHINNISAPIKENDHVSFEVEMGQKGPNAVRVKHHDINAKPKPEELKEGDDKAEAPKDDDGKTEALKEEANIEDAPKQEPKIEE